MAESAISFLEGDPLRALSSNESMRSEDERTHGLWSHTAPEFQTTQLRGYTSAEVTIIGGGFTGLSTALHLAERGISAVVLESAHVGFGGSGRNVGLVNAGLWLEPDTVVSSLGQRLGEGLLNLLSQAPSMVFEIVRRHGIDCEATNTGTLHCAVGSKGRAEIERRYKQWRDRGAPVELLTDSDCALKLGTTVYSGALLDLRAGTIQPLSYVRGLAEAAVRSGAQIFTRDAVRRIEHTSSGWSSVTALGSASSKWVVVATDVYATGPYRSVAHEQIRLPYFNVATAPLADALARSVLPERQGAWDTQRVLRSFRMDGAGRLIFGSVGALRGAGVSIHRAWAKRTIQSMFPQLGDVDLQAEWYGMIGMTGDKLPRFHKLAANIIAVSGYNGRGIAPGTAFGKVLAQYIAGEIADCELPLPETGLERVWLRGFREAAYELGSQAVHLLDAR